MGGEEEGAGGRAGRRADEGRAGVRRDSRSPRPAAPSVAGV